MLVDPLRTQSRAVLVGALVLGHRSWPGCFVFSLIRPGGDAGSATILADRDTSALYVRIGDVVHPALNLTSARLIAGQSDNPTTVKSSEIDKFSRGNLIGIPGAPERMVQNTSRDAHWTVVRCRFRQRDRGHPDRRYPGPAGERATALPADRAVLVQNVGGVHSGTWLLWDGKRSPIDLGNRAVTDALGFGVDIPAPRVIAPGLFNAIPESARAGRARRCPVPVSHRASPCRCPAPVGAVVASFEADNTIRYFAVHADGLQPVSPVLAAILRNSNSYGLQQPPRLGADEVAKLPVVGGIDTSAYPPEEVTLVETGPAPVTCAHWSKPADATESALSLLSGAALPLPDGQRTVHLVGAGARFRPPIRVALAPGSGLLRAVRRLGCRRTARRFGLLGQRHRRPVRRGHHR